MLPGQTSTQTGSARFSAAQALQSPPSAVPSANVQSLDLDVLIVSLDHFNEAVNRSNADAKSTGTGDSKQKSSVAASHLARKQEYEAELDRRLESAKTRAVNGDPAAIRDLVTIAAAHDLVQAQGQEARETIRNLTSPMPGQSAPASPQNPARIKDAVAALAQGYGHALGQRAAAWAKDVLDPGPLKGRFSKVLSQIDSHLIVESERRTAIESQPATVAAYQKGRFFEGDELAPAMRSLERGSFKLYEHSVQELEHRHFPSAPLSKPGDIANALLAIATGSDPKPAVTLYCKNNHWIALIAVPAKRGEEGAQPTLIVFDSNDKFPRTAGGKEEASSSAQGVGRELAEALRKEKFTVRTAFGSLQEKAPNACGPLCFAAVQHAFKGGESSPQPLTAETVAGRLLGFIDQVKPMGQDQVDQLVGSAQHQILDAKAKSDGKSSQPAASPLASSLVQSPALRAILIKNPASSLAGSSSADASNSQSASTLARAAGDAIKPLPEGVFDTAASAVDEETRLLADALTKARSELPPEPGSGFLSSIKQGAERLSDSFIPESRANLAKKAQREVERNRVDGIKSRITALEALRAENGRRRELASAADKALRRWDQVIDPSNPLRLDPPGRAARSARFEREYTEALARLNVANNEYRQLRLDVLELAPLPEPGSAGAAVGQFRDAVDRR